MTTVYSDAKAALFDLTDNQTLLLGGFGLNGIPENCIAALVKKELKISHVFQTMQVLMILASGFCCRGNKLKK